MVVVGSWNVKNLFHPGTNFGPSDEPAYEAKLAALAGVIDRLAPDVLAVQEVGDPEALADLVDRLDGDWETRPRRCSTRIIRSASACFRGCR